MAPSIKRQQGGFTLVEIAIVLVIIGLLLGGILKGQELITSARVRNLADQASGVQAAYYGFIDRYRRVPGDMDPATACTQIGAQNFSGGTCPPASTAATFNNGRIDTTLEASLAWSYLAATGFINGQYTGTGTDLTSDYVAPTNAPQNAFNGAIMLQHSSSYRQAGSTTAPTRMLMFTGRNVPVNVMRELDTKMDDGVADSGVMRATAAGTAPNPQQSEANCFQQPNWNITANAADCGGAYLY